MNTTTTTQDVNTTHEGIWVEIARISVPEDARPHTPEDVDSRALPGNRQGLGPAGAAAIGAGMRPEGLLRTRAASQGQEVPGSSDGWCTRGSKAAEGAPALLVYLEEGRGAPDPGALLGGE